MSDFYDDLLIDSESGVGLISGPEAYRMLGNDGSSQAVTYKTPFDAYAEETTGLINNSLTYARFLRLDFTAPETANYKITCHFMWSLDVGNSDFRSKLELDNTTEIGYRRQIHEPKDAAGNGETLGIVGESGSGKTVTAMSILKLLPKNAIISDGTISFNDGDMNVDILSLSEKELLKISGGELKRTLFSEK